MSSYLTRHVAVTATGQTAFANNLAGVAESILPPSGHIKEIIVSLSKSITDVAGAGATFSIRLVSTTMGQQDITVGGISSDTTSTGGAKVVYPLVLPVDITCGANAIQASVFENGVDPGTVEVTLTLVFD